MLTFLNWLEVFLSCQNITIRVNVFLGIISSLFLSTFWLDTWEFLRERFKLNYNMRTITQMEEENSSPFFFPDSIRADVTPFKENVKAEFSFEAWWKYVLLFQSRFPFIWFLVIKKSKAELGLGLTLQFLRDVQNNELHLSIFW